MITKELRLESFDAVGMQYPLHGRHGRLSKLFSGGEDSTLSFDLDRDPRIDYRDVAYGNEVIVRRGLNPVWKGAMREITQGEETITVGCSGNWVFLDDFTYGWAQPGRLWCENRYALWKPAIGIPGVTWYLERFEHDQRDRLHAAPRRNEIFGNAPWIVGGFSLEYESGGIDRVSFDFEANLAANWQIYLRSWSTTWGAQVDEWMHNTVGATSGTKDISITGGRRRLAFFIVFNAANARWAGETGDIYFTITNLRLWGEWWTETPSVIHVAEDVVDELTTIIPAGTPLTPIEDNTDAVLELMPARDFFTDANGTLLANHRPDRDELRGGWNVVWGGFDIQGNQANISVLGAGNSALAVIDTGESDGVVACDVTLKASTTHGIGIAFRYTDLQNYWLLYLWLTSGNLELGYYQAGVWVPVATDTLGAQGTYTYSLMVKLRGDQIDGYLGGIQRVTTNNTFNQTATHHGMRGWGTQGLNSRFDNWEFFQAPPIWPLFYEDGESCHRAMRDAASFGDYNYRALGWGVETGTDRVFVREADRESVRYVIPAQFCRQLTSRGKTQDSFYTEGRAKHYDDEGQARFTEYYYVHVTNDGLEVNTTATGDDLASTVYGVRRYKTFEFGRVDAGLAVEYLVQTLQEQGHPQVQSTIEVFGPVQDLHHGGALIEPVEMEMGYLVRIPFFRAKEAEGGIGSDMRDWDTTFLMVGLEVDLEQGIARLIPEGAQEDLERMIKAARSLSAAEAVELTDKRSRVIGG